MKNILKIFRSDVKEIFRKANTFIIVFGLILLPSMYAWPNILASWDPYSHTNEIKVAVVSQDKGAKVENKDVNIGNSLIDNLKSNTNLNWQFVDSRDAAIDGVKIGDYYASIVIPENFSEDITSVTKGTPIKATIEYTVNEKVNAISPKITNSGASSIANNISKSFVETANGVIFSKLHEAGFEFENSLPTLKRMKEEIKTLNENFGTYQETLTTTISKVENGQNILNVIQGTLPEIDNAAVNSIMLAEKTGVVINNVQGFNEKLLPIVNDHLSNIEEVAGDAKSIAQDLQNLPSNKEQLKTKMQNLDTRYSNVLARLEVIRSIFNYLNELSINKIFTNKLQTIDNLKERIEKLKEINSTIYNNLDKYEELSTDLKNDFLTGTISFEEKVTTFHSELNETFAPKIEEVLNTAGDKVSQVTDIIYAARDALPEVNNKLNETTDKVNLVHGKLLTLNGEMPKIKEAIAKVNQKFKDSEGKINEQELFKLLQTDYKTQAEFFANPVKLQDNKLYHIENYGSAMTPFYTVLSIWVGALLMSSLLTTRVIDIKNKYKPYEKYFGRLILFIIISLLQTLVITLGDMYILGTQANSPYRFVVYALLISLLFSTIIYTVVSVLGNVGKAVCIILLVLQIGSSGGTFPIQMTGKFFQALYPNVPFTYSIGLLREAVGGVYMPAVEKDMKFLITAFIITLVIGVTLVSLKAKSEKLSAERERSKLFL